MVWHIDVVFNFTDQRHVDLLHRLATFETSNGPVFKVHLMPYPTPTRKDLEGVWSGILYPYNLKEFLDKNVLEQIDTMKRNGVDISMYEKKYNPKGMEVLRLTEENPDDKEDQVNWKHLGIVLPDRRGKVPASIKRREIVDLTLKRSQHLIGGVHNEGNIYQFSSIYKEDKQNKAIPPKYIYRVKYGKKIIVLCHPITPNMTAVGQYDRVWIPELAIKAISRKCQRCRGGKMRFTEPLKKDSKSKKRDFIVDNRTMKCDSCGHTAPHPKVIYVGKDFKNVDLIDEYEKVMGAQ